MPVRVHLGGEPLRDVLGRHHRVDAARADLVGPRRHPDHAERTRADPPTSWPICLSSAMSAALRVRSRNTTASTRGTPSSGTSSRSVRAETSRDSDDVPGVSMMVASISSAAGHSTSRSMTSSGSSLAKSNVRPRSRRVRRDRHVGAPPAAVIGGHLRGRAVPEPGDDAGGLGGVGRRDLLADQRIDQRRLAGLERPGQRDAHRLVQPAADPLELVVHVGTLTVCRVSPVGGDGAAQDRPHVVAGAQGSPFRSPDC